MGSEVAQAILNAVLQHAHSGHDPDDRKNPHTDTQQSEHRPGLVRPDGVERDGDDFSEFHRPNCLKVVCENSKFQKTNSKR